MTTETIMVLVDKLADHFAMCSKANTFTFSDIIVLKGIKHEIELELEKPIDMVLYCPACGTQHIDAPDYIDNILWTNPPHRSHLCNNCEFIWRPADVPTNGVKQIKTAGKSDSVL